MNRVCDVCAGLLRTFMLSGREATGRMPEETE